MLLSIDVNGIKFSGGYDDLEVRVPFVYFYEKANKLEGFYVLKRSMDYDDRWIEITEVPNDAVSDLEALKTRLIDMIDSFMMEYTFYKELINLDLSFGGGNE